MCTCVWNQCDSLHSHILQPDPIKLLYFISLKLATARMNAHLKHGDVLKGSSLLQTQSAKWACCFSLQEADGGWPLSCHLETSASKDGGKFPLNAQLFSRLQGSSRSSAHGSIWVHTELEHSACTDLLLPPVLEEFTLSSEKQLLAHKAALCLAQPSCCPACSSAQRGTEK